MKKLILISFMFVVAGCGKQPAYHPPVAINTDVLNTFNYQQGTYWVYADALTGHEDSFYVSRNSTAQMSAGLDLVVYNECTIYTSDTEVIYFELFANALKIQYDDIYYDPLTVYPFKQGKINPADVDGGKWRTKFYADVNTNVIHPSFSLFGHTFNAVAEVIHSGNIIFDTAVVYSMNDTMYISADAGLVKMCLHEKNPKGDYRKNKVLMLKRYHIVK